MRGILSGGPLASKGGILSYNGQTSLEDPPMQPTKLLASKGEEAPAPTLPNLPRVKKKRGGEKERKKSEALDESAPTLRTACHRKGRICHKKEEEGKRE